MKSRASFPQRRVIPWFSMLLWTSLVMSIPGSAAAAHVAICHHVLESAGSIPTTPHAYDTMVWLSYTGGLLSPLPPSSATVDLYLYDRATSLPLRSALGTNVCNPCTFTLGAGSPVDPVIYKRGVRIDDLIKAAGGFAAPLVEAFGVLNISGDDNRVAALIEISHANTGEDDVSTDMFNPKEYLVQGTNLRTMVIPNLIEMAGTVSTTPFTFDTRIYASYVGGIGGIPVGPAGGAGVSLYLFDDSGSPMTGASGLPVCGPCGPYFVDGTNRSLTFNLDDLIITNGGGFDTPKKRGFGVIVVHGDVANVELRGFVQNSHSSAFDLSVFGFTPTEIQAADLAAVYEPDHQGAVRALRRSPNPARDEVVFSIDLAREADIDLEVFDGAGRRISSVRSGHQAAGGQEVRWKARDGRGYPLPSGLYYARLRAGDGSSVSKFVILP